jgi:hypothetical protein
MAMTITTKINLPGEMGLVLGDLVHELQQENLRLKRLVAEMLLRNQQLRTDLPRGHSAVPPQRLAS